MSLNIKNQRVHDLAREAARVTGKTQTSAIEEALVLLLKEYDADPAQRERERKLARVRQITADFDRDLTDEDRARIRTYKEWMYDDNGFPVW